MKRLFLSLAFAIPCIAANTQTFHAFIFGKTDDRTIGTSASQNMTHIRELSGTIAQSLKMNPDIVVFDGPRFNYETLDSLLKNFKTAPNDVVFFYLNSHGYRHSSNDLFPRIVIRSSQSKKYLLSTSTINSRLRASNAGAQSIVTVIQACNKTTSIAEGFDLLPKGVENYESLFLSKKNVMVTSSQRGRTSIATSKGSVFTNAFIFTLHEEVIKPRTEPLTWEEVLEKTKAACLKKDRKRHPVWNISNL
jgi:hypothetical protein